MKNILLAFLRLTLLRFSGNVATITLKSGAKLRFRCDEWGFKHTNGADINSYTFDRTRSMLGTPLKPWISIPDIAAITVRSWRLF